VLDNDFPFSVIKLAAISSRLHNDTTEAVIRVKIEPGTEDALVKRVLKEVVYLKDAQFFRDEKGTGIRLWW
jgi:hypothetical protein